MKYSKMILMMGLGTAGVAALATSAFADTTTVNATVERYLTNPDGQVDGLLLSDGVQIHLPPHLSSQLTSAVQPKDAVTIKGEKENNRVVRADSITNTKTAKSVVDTPPERGAAPPRPPGPPPGGPGRRENLREMSASGKIRTQLLGRRSEVNGAILEDGTLVRFGPRLSENSKVKMDVGQTLKAKGYGTENEYGRTFEATEISN